MSEPEQILEKMQTPHYLGHRERQRQKLLSGGGGVFSDYELLEYLLMTAIPRRDVKPLAKDLISRFSSLAGVFAASPEELMSVKGIKESAASLIVAVRESAVRMGRDDLADEPVLNNWDAVVRYCKTAFGRNKIELFAVLFLDTKKKLIKAQVLQEGTIDRTSVYPRELVKKCLDSGAASVIMVHNHPTGDLTPSRNDLDLTKTIENALNAVDIELIDHLIVSKRGHFSFKAKKYL